MASKKELTELDHLIINSIIGSAKHEGYVDDGFMRSLLEKKHRGEITSKEAIKLVNDHYLKVWKSGKTIYIQTEF